MSKSKDIAPREFRGLQKKVRKGLLLIFTGNGKGKSTAAFGVVFRSLGRGYKAAVVQFIKGPWVSGEIKSLEKFGDKAEFHSVGDGFTWDTKNPAKDIESAKLGWALCMKLLRQNRHDVFLFDELLYVLKYKFLTLETVMKGLKRRHPRAHVILTGRDVPRALVAKADLVTEMREVKHPYKRGIIAQPGIDY